MHRRKFIQTTGTAGLLLWLTPSDVKFLDQGTSNFADQNFQQPPSSLYPKLIWFWMNGNISKEGITLDLEAMKKIGISGVFNFDAGEGSPKGPITYWSKEWIELKKHAVSEASRLGIEFVQHNCPGWSASGGPWITPDLAMQQITWSETFVTGGSEVNIQLAEPQKKLNYYRDIAVLAFPSLQGEAPLESLLKEVSSGDQKFSIHQLSANDTEGVSVFQKNNSSAYLQFEFYQPYEARFLNFFISAIDKNDVHPEKKTSVLLEFSDDGLHFKKLAEINTGLEPGLVAGNKFITYDIPVTKAKFFRLSSDRARRYREVRFSGVARLDHFMEKAGYRFMFNADEIPGITQNNEQIVPPSSIIDLNSVLDISQFMNEDGKIKWEAPRGNWTILRMGFTPTGSTISAAPDNAFGLECDKFSRSAFDFHFGEMMKYLLPALKEIKSKIGLEIDSYEAGMQNWTPLFSKEFQKRKAYDLLKYLPALTGRVINSADHSERFLWDFRRTQADLMAENYYGRFHELCHQHGFTSYIEPYERGPMEEMQAGTKADVVMGEFWNGIFSVLQNNFSIRRITKLVSSISHVNAKKLVGAESFTSEEGSSKWQEYPFALKAAGDRAFTKGINEIIFHCYTHQPHPTAKPGLSLGPYGIHFERTNTWWHQSRPWMDYLARCQYLLQQGLFVADLLYFTGEETHSYTKTNRNELNPMPPIGYDYDLINAEAILHRVRIIDGRIALPDGMSYRIMKLPNQNISLQLVRKLHQLVQEGMILVGTRPHGSLSLSDVTDEASFQQLLNELWPDSNGKPVSKKLGKGIVYQNTSLETILQQFNIQHDFQYSSRSGNASVQFIHRRDQETEIYFLANQKRKSEELVCTFRVQNKMPELWNAVTGKIIPIPFYESSGGMTQVPIRLEPNGSVFVVFRSPTSSHYKTLTKDGVEIISTKAFSETAFELHKGVTNNFTISFWVKPEIEIMLTPSIYMATIKNPWTDAYAIYPPSGKELYGQGHATIGLTVGRNGIAIWEHGSDDPMLIISVGIPIEGWSHVALVYNDGLPELYLNGNLIQTGKKSDDIIHPALGEDPIPEGNSYFIGDISRPVLYRDVFSANQISKLFSDKNIGHEKEPAITFAERNNKPALLIRQNGNYVLQNEKQVSSFKIENIGQDIFVKGPWKLQFPEGLAAPREIILDQLLSLHTHPNNAVRYFSGTVAYINSFILSVNDLMEGKHLFLDLGRVEVIAEVHINDKSLGVLWKRPYKIDITNAAKPGKNKLVIKITNLWVNRLIGDEQVDSNNSQRNWKIGALDSLPEWYLQLQPKPNDGRITFTAWKYYSKNDALVESGLIGPVTIQTAILKSL